MSNITNCQICSKTGHVSVRCTDMYIKYQGRLCNGTMHHYIYDSPEHRGRRFIRCQFFSERGCREEEWYQEPVPPEPTAESTTNNNKVEAQEVSSPPKPIPAALHPKYAKWEGFGQNMCNQSGGKGKKMME